MTARDDPHDPFDDLFREIERMMNSMLSGSGNVRVDTGFGSDTHIDIHEQEKELRVIADLPGVEKQDIGLKCDGRILMISARNDRRSYDERIQLPARVDEDSASAKYNNGVLEVVFQRESRSSDIDVE